MKFEQEYLVIALINIFWYIHFEVTFALVCSDIPPAERVECGSDGENEVWCLNQGCCFEDTHNSGIPKCYYRADRRKIRFYMENNTRYVEFDNKQYILMEIRLSRYQLAAQCATFGSEYKPAYINYVEEYEMLRPGVRLHHKIREAGVWWEGWLGGSLSVGRISHYSRSDQSTTCPILAYESYNPGVFGRTVVLLAKLCSHNRARGICERHTGILTGGVPLSYADYDTDEECYVFTNNGKRGVIYSQNVTIDNVQDEFVLEIPMKSTVPCSGMVFGLRKYAASCGAMYFKESDCKMLETLPNEESCYVRCYCNNTCDGNLIMNVERDEQQWTLCPMSIA